jgi:hypothetical protein
VLEYNVSQISDIKTLNFKNSVFVIGSAPSIRRLKLYPNLTGVKIGVGDVPWRAKKFGPYDFWITANTGYPLPWIPKHFKHLKNSGAKILLSSVSVCDFRGNIIDKLSEIESLGRKIPLIFYDQRHFGRSFCDPIRNCCFFSKNLIKDLSIQEILSGLIGSGDPVYSEGDSVTLHALALAIILKAKRIYIIGVELPLIYKNYKYYKDYKVPFESPIQLLKRISKRILPKYSQQIPDNSHNQINFFKDIQKIVGIACNLGIEVFSLSKTSPLNFIEGIRFLDDSSWSKSK